MKRSQTATEYLVILAVVIIIALVVVGILGGIPSIGGGVNKQANDVALFSQDVAIINYATSSNFTRLQIQNNVDDIVIIENISVNDRECIIVGGDVRISKFQSTIINCINLTFTEIGSRYANDFSITWRELSTDATFTRDENSLVGRIADVSTSYVLDASDSESKAFSDCLVSPEDTYDGSFSSFGGLVSGTCGVYHNYTIPENTVGGLFEIHVAFNPFPGVVSASCRDQNGNSVQLESFGQVRVNLTIPPECFENKELILYGGGGGPSQVFIYEEQVWFEVIDN